MDTLPKTRGEWARCDWQEAQSNVAKLLNYNGFTRLEEARLGKGRADVVVFRKDIVSKVGIIEVKCYSRVSNAIQKKAIIQSCNYLNQLYIDLMNNGNWNKRNIRFFIAVIFTKDYPSFKFNFNKSLRKKYLIEELQKIKIYVETPDRLIQILQKSSIAPKKASSLDDFF